MDIPIAPIPSMTFIGFMPAMAASIRSTIPNVVGFSLAVSCMFLASWTKAQNYNYTNCAYDQTSGEKYPHIRTIS